MVANTEIDKFYCFVQLLLKNMSRNIQIQRITEYITKARTYFNNLAQNLRMKTSQVFFQDSNAWSFPNITKKNVLSAFQSVKIH